MDGATALRIGELSRRAGVSPELLRAWERRYDLLRPTRSAGGLRLYSLDDLARVRLMRQHLADGLAAAEAAALVSAGEGGVESSARPALAPDTARRDLAAALESYDEPRAQTVIDGLLAAMTTDALLTEVVLPYLDELGQRWERGEASVAQEHFASAVLRGRMLGLARGWGRGLGPLALLACPPGEQHDLGLIAFGLALRARGWRIAFLGSDTPLDTVEAAAAELDPALVALSTVTSERLKPEAARIRKLAKRYRVAIGGRAAKDARGLGATALPGNPVSAAEHATALVHAT